MESSLTTAMSASTFDVTQLPQDLPDDPQVLKAIVAGQQSHISEMQKTHVEMKLEFQQYISAPPVPKKQLWQQACSNDGVTTESWRKTWLEHVKINTTQHGADESMVDQLYGRHKYLPGICAGSGPSLKKNVGVLAKEKPSEFPIVSALHNYSFFTDNDVDCKYYTTLDAGPITLTEVTEGGKKSADYYWDSTKDKILIAGLPSFPPLIDKWQGEVYWFNATIPDELYNKEMLAMTKNRYIYSVGGNVLGACLYHSLFIHGSCPIAFVGADFAFDYNKKFHGWDSQYDEKFSGVVPVTDIFGNRRFTWPSYYNFKAWFDFMSMGGNSGHPAVLVNCTEGGIMGSYPEGNIVTIKQMALEQFFGSYRNWEKLHEFMQEYKDKGVELVAMM